MFNASRLGAMFGYMVHSPSATNFFHFVTAHGPFELTAVVLMAAAGMRLGFSMIDTARAQPGRRRVPRRAAERASDVGGRGPLPAGGRDRGLCIASTVVSYDVKAGIAVLSIVMLLFYFIVLGYPGRKDDSLTIIRSSSASAATWNSWTWACGPCGARRGRFPGPAGRGRSVRRAQCLAAQPCRGGSRRRRPALAVSGPDAGGRALGTAFGHRPGNDVFGPSAIRSAAGGQADCPRVRPVVAAVALLPGPAPRPLLATVVGAIMPFVANPYLNEVILLERNPMRAKGKKSISTAERSRVLHRGQGGDLFIRWMLNMLMGSILVVVFWGSLAAAASWLLNEKYRTGPFYTCLYPATLWMVAAYFTVVRFLGYLDLRIRREGWEVELLMRAELDRWTRMPQAS